MQVCTGHGAGRLHELETILRLPYQRLQGRQGAGHAGTVFLGQPVDLEPLPATACVEWDEPLGEEERGSEHPGQWQHGRGGLPAGAGATFILA